MLFRSKGFGTVGSKKYYFNPSDGKAKTDDLELVAVIAAAIAASTGASPDGFVVRSIRKVKR